MTSALRPLPDEYAGPIFELLDAVRAAAAPPDAALLPVWAAAEAGQTPVRTGYKAYKRTASAGQYAAHALRIAAGRDLVPRPTADRTTTPPAWTAALTGAGPAISSWDWDERMQAAIDLRATFKDLPEPVDPTVLPVRYVAAWLQHTGRHTIVGAAARLARYALDAHGHDTELLALAWYATHGHRLLAGLDNDAQHEARDLVTTQMLAAGCEL